MDTEAYFYTQGVAAYSQPFSSPERRRKNKWNVLRRFEEPAKIRTNTAWRPMPRALFFAYTYRMQQRGLVLSTRAAIERTPMARLDVDVVCVM